MHTTQRFRGKAAVILMTLGLGLLAYACGQDYNSNSGDGSLGGPPAGSTCGTEAEARYCAARSVLANRCFRCHGAWADYADDAAWGASGLVVAGNADGSSIVSKTINAGGNMPLNGTALPDDEYQALRSWIAKLAAQ